MQGEQFDQRLAFWEEKLRACPPLDLPTDFKRPKVQSTNGNIRGFTINKQITKGLYDLCREKEVTLFMLLLAAFKVLLYRYSGQTDFCIGTPVANRHKQELENLVGIFINTIAVRSNLSGNPSFSDYLLQIKKITTEAYSYQDIPFEKVVNKVVTERDLSRSPLFQVLFILQNTASALQAEEKENNSKLNRIPFAPMESHINDVVHRQSKYDMTMNVVESEEALHFNIEFCTDLFKMSTIEQFCNHFINLLSSIVDNASQSIDSLEILNESEKNQLLFDFNKTYLDYPKKETILDLFARQVKQQPENIALIFEEKTLTYKKLEEKSNQLASYLRKNRVREKTRIGICTKRSMDMVIGLLGILKSGATYVPLDPAYPPSRISYIIKDAEIKLILCDQFSEKLLDENDNIETILLDKERATIEQEPTQPINVELSKDSIAYIIFTSGSTGNPKGVVVGHDNVNAFVNWAFTAFDPTTFDIVYSVTSICFDLSVFEIFYTLGQGKKLRIVESGMTIGDYLTTDRLVMLITVPSVLNTMLMTGVDFSNVVMINSGGEAISTQILNGIDTDRIIVQNLFGPSETTVYSSGYRLRKEKPILIGKPITNTQLYILDKSSNLVPIGVKGELCIGGDGVTKGYLGKSELTNAKFIDNPFDQVKINSKIYKTGDIARWLPDGNVEFLGRRDNQIKIRGFRVELGEVETVLESAHFINRAVVILHKDAFDNKMIVAYIQPMNTYNETQIKAYIEERLPKYMMPSFLIEMNEFPLLPNGKINRNVLQSQKLSGPSQDEYTAPTNAVEKRLIDIWKLFLTQKEIGIKQNFFDIGGNSLLSMRLLVAIKKAFNYDLEIRDFFATPYIDAIAKKIMSTDKHPSETKNTDKSILTPLNKIHESQQNIFMVPPVLGLSLIYMPLAMLLDKEGYNCYGFNYKGVNNDLSFDKSIPEMAISFVNEIAQLVTQKEKTLKILGYSMGANIAFEMVHLLEQKGYHCELVLLDSNISNDLAEDSIAEGAQTYEELAEYFVDNHLKMNTVDADYRLQLVNAIEHYLSLIYSFEFTGKTIAANLTTFEADCDMEEWRELTKGDFVRCYLQKDHFGVLDADVLPLILKSLTK